MKSNKKVTSAIDEALSSFTTELSAEVIDSFRKQLPNTKDYKKAISLFLAKVIAQVVFKDLKEAASKGNRDLKERYEATLEVFKEAKGLIQDSVAAAFASAMTEFSGKQVDYYCVVHAIPPSANKQPI